jgi:hypothetical protein
MKHFDWSDEKNEILQRAGRPSFEDVVAAIESGGILDRVAHPNAERYAHQKILYVTIDGYAYAVPLVEDGERVFLKTVFPDRKATKKYLGGKDEKEA